VRNEEVSEKMTRHLNTGKCQMLSIPIKNFFDNLKVLKTNYMRELGADQIIRR
jgi:hypothetical protein